VREFPKRGRSDYGMARPSLSETGKVLLLMRRRRLV
jgi:hypothetical protein